MSMPMSDQPTVQLTLTVRETNVLLEVLGEMPTKMAVFPLAVKIKQQAESQLQPVTIDGE